VRQGKLHTEEDSGPAIDVLAFAETGKAPRIPGPLIRVRQGTELIVRITNPFKDSMLTVHGLSDHIDQTDSPIHIPAGESREVRFRATVPGTFFYWATTGNRELRDLDWFESALNGAFIVDSPAAPTNDRIFVLGVYDRPADSTGGRLRPEQIAMTMNGKSWPHTEHFTYAQGDTVRWRWINPSTDSHPMHLHGFYYRLQSKGTWQGEKEFSSAESPQVVTNLMLAGTTMKMWWVADRPGNWIFHCHFSFHTSHYLALPRDGEQSPQAVVRQTDSSAKGMTMTHGPHGMFGLVLGLNILPNGRKRSTASTTMEVRRIRLVAQQKSNRFGKFIGMGYVTQEGNEEPKADSVSIPGPLLILKRGQPTSITVVNHLNEPTAVHWHGIELESFPDGVPGWSGFPGRIMPPIAPRDSFVAEFVPPRAGTFIYHTHDNDQLQMSSGLYGALLVVPRDKPYNPKIDKLFIVGGAGPSDSLPNGSPGYVNGSDAPAAVHLVLGTTYRLRLININPDWRVIFTILSESGMESWRPIAVDGADLPLSQQTLRPANLMTGPGMTADFEFTPRSRGDLRFEIKTATPGWIIPVVLRVN
jgi:Putative multicopper oxidases